MIWVLILNANVVLNDLCINMIIFNLYQFSLLISEVLFDAVLIDVCHDAGDVMCPTESFIRPNSIKNLKKILQPTGISFYSFV